MKCLKGRLGLLSLGLAAVAASTPVLAAEGDMPAIAFPFTMTSVTTVIVAAGVALLSATTPARLGFGLIRSLIRTLKGVVSRG